MTTYIEHSTGREVCGTWIDSMNMACERDAGHDDSIGHAIVRYPEGTPEYAAYRAALRAELAN